MAEDGIADFALAKRKAARQLGAESTQALPNNEEIEDQLRIYQSLYQSEEQRERIRALRGRAFEAMRALEQFRPYLVGPVLSGTAGRYGDIDLQVFTDDGKSLEIFLLNHNLRYEVSNQRRFSGDSERAISVLRLEWEGVPISIAIYPANDERGPVQTSAAGRPIERAGLPAVAQLVGGNA
jgi:hypothetical protein